MDFRYTTEQNLYRQAIREWLTKNLEPRARAIDEAEDGIPDDITAGMAELGMFGVTIPEEYGGLPLPDEERLIYAMITIHEIARADLSMSTPVYTLLTIGWSYIINRYGTDELKRTFGRRTLKPYCSAWPTCGTIAFGSHSIRRAAKQ